MTESIVGLGKSEEWFWNSEPRIVISLISEHQRLERVKQKNLAGYIACCVWGKDPNDYDGDNIKSNENGKVPGRDIPISEDRLRGF